MSYPYRQSICMLILLLAGCRTDDPFGETDCVSCCPSHPYSASGFETIESEVVATAGELEGQTLDLAECIVQALERNPKTRVAWLASRSQAYQVGEARSTYWPQLTLNAGTDRTATINDRKKDESPRSQINALFGVRYLLFTGGLRNARVEGAAAELLAANFRQNTVLQDVALEVELAYYQRLAAKSLVEVAQEYVRRSEYNVKLAEARQKSGVSAKFDVLTAQTDMANAELALVRARNTARVTQGRLARAMGAPVAEKFDIQDLPQDVQQQELTDIQLLLQQAQEMRPELQAALAKMSARHADIHAAEAEYAPQLAANANYGWRDDTFDDSGDEWTIGLSVELPLFTGFARPYRLTRAKNEYQLANARYEDTIQQVALEVWTAQSKLIEAGEAIDAARALVASADESLRVAAGRYRAGAGNIIELVNAQVAQIDARTQHVRAVLNWYTAMANLERTLGRTLAATSPAVPASEQE